VPANIVIGRTQVEANYLATNLACSRARVGKICFLTNGLPNGQLNVPYDFTVRAIGGVPWRFPFLPIGCVTLGVVPYDFRVPITPFVGLLPTGLTLGCFGGGRPGQIMGTPTVPGDFSFFIQATDAVGAYQRKQFTIHIDGAIDYGTITPIITSNAASSWGTVPAGTYKVSYVNGALRYGNNAFWLLNIAFANKGYYIRHSGGTTIEFPGTTGTYGSQALVEAANAGRQITINHTGGTIEMFLDDLNYSDNHPGAPNPTFRLST